MINLTMKL